MNQKLRVLSLLIVVILACNFIIPTPVPTPTLIPTPTLGIGSTMVAENDHMTLVFVPAGEFTMGSNSGEHLDEKPEHQVYLDAFWIDQTEVTNKQYAVCVRADVCIPPSQTQSHTRSRYYGNSEFDNYPVIYVTWSDAITYCSWAGRRLSTEAEWEKAARGTNSRIYPWGNESPNNGLLNYNGNTSDTTKVGSYPDGKSIYGALDMAGNVWEWVSSLYRPYPYDAHDGRENISISEARVVRGGSWNYTGFNVHTTTRYLVEPLALNEVGFRCARP